MRISLIAFFGVINAKPLLLGVENSYDTSFTAFKNSTKGPTGTDSELNEKIQTDIVYLEAEDYLNPDDYVNSDYNAFPEIDFSTTIGLSLETTPTEVYSEGLFLNQNIFYSSGHTYNYLQRNDRRSS